MDSDETLWKKVMSAHLMWVSEIEQRLDVEVDVFCNPADYLFWYGPVRGKNEDRAQVDMDQLGGHMGDLYYSIGILRGGAEKLRDHSRKVADLGGRTPWDALIVAGHEYIDAALIGPDARAAEMLAEEPQLLAAARYRVLHTHDLDGFTPHVRQLIANADSILAAKAFDAVLKGES